MKDAVERLLAAGDSIGALFALLAQVGAKPTLYGQPVTELQLRAHAEDIVNMKAESRLGFVSRCVRCNAHAVMWVDAYGLNMANVLHGKPIRRDCRKCGLQHSLGPAADDDDNENVQIELRAAARAFDIDTLNGCERCGSVAFELGTRRSPRPVHVGLYRMAFNVGYLAAAIVAHDEGVE